MSLLKAIVRYEKAENCILSLYSIISRWVPLKSDLPQAVKGALSRILIMSLNCQNIYLCPGKLRIMTHFY